MGKITAAQLVAAFNRYLIEGWGYVYGAQGEMYTEALARRWTGRSVPDGRNKATYFVDDCSIWYGHRVADCSGGIIHAIQQYESGYGDYNANRLFDQCIDSGPVSSIPEIPGLCVWRKKHIGVYVGNGYVIEFRGTAYGCVKARLKERNFTHWGRLPAVDYGEVENEVAKVLGITSPLMRGEDIKALQAALNGLGYPCGAADGVFGAKSMEGVKRFTEAHGGAVQLPDKITVAATVGGRKYEGMIEV